MTPQEISHYKLGWKLAQNFYTVRLHSDIRSRGVDWCKANLTVERWDWSKYSDNYEDTFYFEYKHDADDFKKLWPEYTNQ